MKLLFTLFPLIVCLYANAQISINTNFEGGNGLLTFADIGNNVVHIQSEYKGGDVLRVDYYCEIQGVDYSQDLNIQIDTDWQGDYIYYSYDNINWQSIQMIGGQYSVPTIQSNIFLAHSIPSLYSNMIALVDSINNANNGYTEVSNLTISEQGRSVKLLKITAPKCESYPQKNLIWLLGGQHAFEDPARYVTEGMLRFLVSNDPIAIRLRKQAIIYIVPIMDVDQTVNGGTGKDQIPIDFNRDWTSLSYTSNWNAVVAVKDSVEAQRQRNPYKIFIDSHAVPPSQNITFTYVVDVNKQVVNGRFFKESFDSYSGQNIPNNVIVPNPLNVAVSQSYMIDLYDSDEFLSLTPELSFTYDENGNNWTKNKYLKHGEDQFKAVSDYIFGLAQPGDVLVDNTDAYNSIVGTWPISTTDDVSFMNDLQYASANSNSTFTFTAVAPQTGWYDLFIFYSSYSIHATNAPVMVSTSSSFTNHSVDMTKLGGKWVPLEEIYLTSGEAVYVTISSQGANGNVIADGIRLSPQPINSINVIFNNLPLVVTNANAINLSATPSGGIFSGTAVVFNSFNPTISGSGLHTVNYTFTDTNGCTTTINENILVGSINYNFVNYNLGTIAP